MEEGLKALPPCGDVDARARKRDRADDLVIMVGLDVDDGEKSAEILRWIFGFGQLSDGGKAHPLDVSTDIRRRRW